MTSTYRLALLAAALALAQAASAATLGASTMPAVTTIGGTGTIVVALDLSDAIDLGGATFNLDWDPGLDLQLGSARIFSQDLGVFIGRFDPDPAVSVISSSPGHYGFSLAADFSAEPHLDAGASTMSFSFTGLSEGVQGVKIGLSVSVLDADFNASDVAIDPIATTITVSAVPENSPALMLAAGLGVVGLLASRRRS